MAHRTVRVAAVQIDYQPAYLGRSISYLREPSIIEESENALSSLSQFPDIPPAREQIRRVWIEHIRKKVEAILYFCATHKVDLVVFPEYSIPVEVLPECKDSADNRRMVIVAGSHTVTGVAETAEIYRRVGISGLNLEPTDPDSDIRKAICPIFIPASKPEIIQKMSKSVWESDMTSGQPASCLNLNIRGTSFKVGISLCIDALQLTNLAELYKGEAPPDLFIVPSLSPSTGPFESVCELNMLNEVPSIYVNIASPGGSKITAKSGTACPNWPLERNGVEKLPENSEGVVVAEIDFDEQVDIRKTVRPHLGTRVIAYAPLLYASQSELCRDFIAIRERCLNPMSRPIPEDVYQQLAMLTRTETVLFPSLLKNKIHRFLDSAKSGSLRAEDMRFFLGTVDIPVGICPTFVLRQTLIQAALVTVVGLIQLTKSIPEQERIMKVMRNLTRHRIELPVGAESACQDLINASGKTEKPKDREPDSETNPFFNRQQDMNLIRAFVNSSDQRAFSVKGIKGIGKTALVRRVFIDILPKWRDIWVQVADGISFEQLVSECANKLDIPVTGIPTREEARDLAKSILTRIDSAEATSLTLDDCDNLIGSGGEFSDDDTRRFLMDLVSRPSRRNSKVFLISNATLPLPRESQFATPYRQLHGLEARDTRNLLDYWIRVQREEVRGHPIEIPEKLISFLQGHPLATKIAARLCNTYRPEQLIADLSIFKKLRQAIVDVLLDKVVLSSSQRAFLEYASIFRAGISPELFRKWGGDAALLELDSVLAKFLLDLIDGEYWLHPAIAQYFYDQADAKKMRAYHRIAGDYYVREHSRRHPKDPSLLVEAIHHIAASGDIERAKSLGIHKEQLRTLARSAYSRRDWDFSMSYYEAISLIDPKDLDALARMALLLGRAARWADADRYFERAMNIKETQWVYQAFGAIKINAGLLTEGENLLLHALDLNDHDSAALAGLAVLRLRQGREYEAEKLFREALESNPENSFALSNYVRYLAAHGRRSEAQPLAELLVELEPRNSHARDLLRQVSETIPSANPNVSRLGDAS